MVSKDRICLWYDGTVLDAEQVYAATFPDSAGGASCVPLATIPPASRAMCWWMSKIDIAAIQVARRG